MKMNISTILLHLFIVKLIICSINSAPSEYRDIFRFADQGPNGETMVEEESEEIYEERSDFPIDDPTIIEIIGLIEDYESVSH